MAKWRIVLEGDMPFPVGRIEQVLFADPVPVVVVAPDPPAPPAPADDPRPFVWPADPGALNQSGEMRTSWRWYDPTSGHGYYVQLPEFGNPAPGSHRYAGLTAKRAGSKIPEGHRLWAPVQGEPAIMRAILAGLDPDARG
jgi:hypothetical protein